MSNSEYHADTIRRFDLLLITQSTTIGYHFVCSGISGEKKWLGLLDNKGSRCPIYVKTRKKRNYASFCFVIVVQIWNKREWCCSTKEIKVLEVNCVRGMIKWRRRREWGMQIECKRNRVDLLPSLYQTLIDFGEDSTIHPRVTLFPKGTPTIWLSTVTVGATRKKKKKEKRKKVITSNQYNLFFFDNVDFFYIFSGGGSVLLACYFASFLHASFTTHRQGNEGGLAIEREEATNRTQLQHWKRQKTRRQNKI